MILVLSLICLPDRSSAQYADFSGSDYHELIQQLTEGLDPEDFENEAAFEDYLTGLIESFPIDLNTAGYDSFLFIPDITDALIHAIIEYREEQAFRSPDELLEVPGIGPATLQQLRPWVTVGNRSGHPFGFMNDVGMQHLFRFQQTFPVASGYRGDAQNHPHYTGSPIRFFHRQTITGTGFSGNLTQVKLPGEPMNNTAGFDFTSAHINFENNGYLRRFIVGDYALRFGQGLVLWSAASFGKGGAAHSASFRNSHKITPYRSSGQMQFLRGAATELAFPVTLLRPENDSDLVVSLFYSNRPRSALEVTGDTIRPPTSSPFHRTESEISRRFNTREKILGGNISLESRKGHAGFTYYSYILNRPVLPYPHSSVFQGSNNRAFGADFSLRFNTFRVFGEIGTRSRKESERRAIHSYRIAWIAGITGRFRNNIDWIFSRREYGPGFWSEYGSGFGEGVGVPANQTGWYFGMRIRPAADITLSGFIDRFTFPEPRRYMTRPSDGWEPMLELRYRLRPELGFLFRIRYKERSTELESQDDHLRTYRITDTEQRLSGRARIHWEPSSNVRLQTQIDHLKYESHSGIQSTGLAFSQKIRWQVFKRLQIDLSRAAFETDDFTSRIYLYEYDLSHAMGSTMVYGLGSKSYAVIRYQPFGWMLMEAKYRRVRYLDRPAVGSGHDLTEGPIRSSIGFQLRLRY